MKIFDFNIHLPISKDSSEAVDRVIERDMSLNTGELISGYEYHQSHFVDVNGANFQLFNTKLFDHSITEFKQKLNKGISTYLLTALIDFRKRDILNYIDEAIDQGVGAVMFNSFLQKISSEDYESVIKVCKYAESKNLIICIDGSYGTSKMFTYLNLPLICKVAENVTTVPIIIIHSGGANIIEAMLLAMDKENIFLETSFSLPFYLGSSLEKDYAFAYKKIGASKVLFGSDHPYNDFSDALNKQVDFFEKYDFTQNEIEKIFYKNALSLLNV